MDLDDHLFFFEVWSHTNINMDEGRVLHVRAIGREVSQQELMMYFQSPKHSGGGDISTVELNEGEAVIKFEESDGELKFHFMICFDSFVIFTSAMWSIFLFLKRFNYAFNSPSTFKATQLFHCQKFPYVLKLCLKF